MILGMVTRTALGHLGRPLQTDRSMVLSYALIILAALLRLAALLPSSAVTGLLHASATAWALALALICGVFSDDDPSARGRAPGGAGDADQAGGGAARLNARSPRLRPPSAAQPSRGRRYRYRPPLPGNGGRPGFGQRRQRPPPALRQRMHRRIAGAHARVALPASLRVRDEQLARSTAPAA